MKNVDSLLARYYAGSDAGRESWQQVRALLRGLVAILALVQR